jgi:hypothetical protein
MTSGVVVGVAPRLPWPLYGRPWWTEPVRAERLAALRIGVALVLLLDIGLNYLPHVADFYAAGGLGATEVFAANRAWPNLNWSLVVGDDPVILQGYMLAWAVSGTALLLGLLSRLNAVVAWALAVSFLNRNPYIHNAGDSVRIIMLFYLMLTPCGAAWSLDAWLRRLTLRRVTNSQAGPVFVAPWALRLLFVQLALIYFFNGIFKLAGQDWQSGAVLWYVLADVSQTRTAFGPWGLPEGLLQATAWAVLAWEIGFPLLVAMPATRTATLAFGVLVHVGIGLSIELAMFPLCMICMYLPLVPWERWTGHGDARHREFRLTRSGQLV